MKALLVALTLFSASYAQAAAFTAKPFPASPVVIDADATDDNGDEVKGSWFRASFDLENTSVEDMQIVSIEMTVSLLGAVLQTIVIPVNDYLSANSTTRLGPYWVQDLRVGKGYNFDVDAKIMGYSSDSDGQPTARIEEHVHFQTQ